MFNLFEGGIKGRFFNNPAKGGASIAYAKATASKGERKMKKGIGFVVVMLGALLLVGWGCGRNSAAPADTNSDTNVVSDSSQDNTPEATNEDGTTSEDTSDTTGEVPAGFVEYRSDRYGFSFQYPEGWRISTFDDDPSRIGIIAPDNPSAVGSEPLPEVSVILRNNPDRLAIRDFYERMRESIFDEATGGVSPLEVGGNQGFSLLGVSGEVTTDLVVLANEGRIAEFELTRSEYREVFDSVVGSFQFTGGE